MPEIVFDRVSKSYGDLEVLPEFDLKLDDGEFTVLVGPSGCGKSTTLRMLAGLETITSGEIFFDGRPVGRLEPKDRDIAMVFQDYALYPHMNIARNMSFALRLQKVPAGEIDRRVKRVADTLGIGHLLHRKPGALSGGQRQRVAMGRALVRDAGTFLFDEPLSNLDAKLRGRMRTELAQMRDTIDKNMIYVTHDQIEAMTLGDRIVVMSDGRIQQQGTPEELFREPRNTFVAAFIGSPTIVLTLGIGCMAAYALVRFRFMGRDVVSLSTLMMRMVPPAVLLVPVFGIWTFQYGISGTLYGIILIYTAMNLPFVIWILQSFIVQVPIQLEEAARVDGVEPFRTFFFVVLPLIKPGLAAAAIFTFRIAWNEFLLGNALADRNTRTVPVTIVNSLTEYNIDWGVIMATGTLLAIPPIVFTLFASRQIITGMTAGAVKG